MSDNALSGSILASLGNLTNLTTLVFASNSLSSSIPGQILIAAQLGLSAMIPVSSIASFEVFHIHIHKNTGCLDRFRVLKRRYGGLPGHLEQVGYAVSNSD